MLRKTSSGLPGLATNGRRPARLAMRAPSPQQQQLHLAAAQPKKTGRRVGNRRHRLLMEKSRRSQRTEAPQSSRQRRKVQKGEAGDGGGGASDETLPAGEHGRHGERENKAARVAKGHESTSRHRRSTSRFGRRQRCRHGGTEAVRFLYVF